MNHSKQLSQLKPEHNYFMNYRVKCTGLTGLVCFKKKNDREAKQAVTLTLEFFSNYIYTQLTAVNLYKRIRIEGVLDSWVPISLDKGDLIS